MSNDSKNKMNPSARIAGWPAATRRIVTAAATLVAAGTVAAAAVLFVQDRGDERTLDSRSSATSAAVEKVPVLLSYDFNSVDAQLGAALESLTGDFRKQYETLAGQVIAPAAREKSVTTSATVVESAVVESSENEVTLLLFLNQTTTSRDRAEPKLDGSRVTVAMEKVGDDWKIADVTPV